MRWRGIASKAINEKITDADKIWALDVEVDNNLSKRDEAVIMGL